MHDMTENTLRAAREPYQVGDTVRLLHDGPRGRRVLDLPVTAVTPMSDRRWRVTAWRGGSYATVDVIVDATGKDPDRYVRDDFTSTCDDCSHWGCRELRAVLTAVAS
jgi:hypothetical protein